MTTRNDEELPPQDELFDGRATLIVEIIMTQHWDIAACRCWICQEGRAAGCRPRTRYLRHQLGEANRPTVTVVGQ